MPAIVAKIFLPYAVAVDGQGSLHIAELSSLQQGYGARVRKVDANSQSGATIEFAALASKTYGDPDFTVSASASTGLPVSFTASGNCTVTGTTVHLVDYGVDTGPILAQEPVPVLAKDTEETLHERIKEVERRLLPQTVAGLITGAVAPAHRKELDR